MSLLLLKLGIYSQILTPSAMSTALAVWPGVYWLSDGSLFQYFSFQYWTTNHLGKHIFVTSFFACSYIFPFVKLASCAELISSTSVFVPFKLCFLLAPHSSEFLKCLSLVFEFIFLFFLPLSGPVRVDGVPEHILGNRACGSPTCWSSVHSHAKCPVLSMLLFFGVSGCVSIRSLVHTLPKGF